ncbi:MAG: trypsin-like serine peptidase [Pseudomonadota bacterium]
MKIPPRRSHKRLAGSTLSFAAFASALALAALCTHAFAAGGDAPQVAGEYSRTVPMPAPVWRAPDFPATHVASMRYGEMTPMRLLELQRKNAAPGLKATQVGIGRDAARESARSHLPALQWRPVAGGFVARIEIRSPDAMALRVGLDVQALDDRVELRFGGSTRSSEVVAMTTGAEAKRLPGSNGLYWTPATDGEAQIIEVFRPKGVPAFAVRLDAPSVSHLVADSRSGYALIEKIGFGQSQSCNVDTICRVGELGQAYVNAKNAVAQMQFVVGGSTFYCSGTLLADSVPSTQIPYFWAANHCFTSNRNLPPNPTQMQTVANTLNTYWNYETTGCGNLTQSTTTVLGGGATYLYSSHVTDAMLIRLNNPPPAFAYFSGWNAGPLAAGVDVLAIHHPNGDSKKVSGGRTISFDSAQTEVGWLTGTTEGGSSGSGLFTLNARGEYVLRGGLFGGFAACSNSGSLSNPDNRDYYSRLDVEIANVRNWLEPQPTPLDGNRPRLRARGTAKPAAPATPATQTSTRAASERDAIVPRGAQRK